SDVGKRKGVEEAYVPVDQVEVQRGEGDTQDIGDGTGLDGGGTEGRADGLALDLGDRERQRTTLDQHGQLLRGLRGEGVAGDGGGTARHTDLTADLRVDLGRRDDLVVEHDRHAA